MNPHGREYRRAGVQEGRMAGGKEVKREEGRWGCTGVGASTGDREGYIRAEDRRGEYRRAGGRGA